MNFVTTQPDTMASAANQLAGIGSELVAQNAAAMVPATAVVPAAADEVSALTAAQFTTHAALYQQVGANAAVVHDLFVNVLRASAGSYAHTEAANANSAL